MSAIKVAIIVTPGFSAFHFSVPNILFGSKMAEPELFHVAICAEEIGTVQAEHGLSVQVEKDLGALAVADIVIVPYWHHPEERPSQRLLDALVSAWRRGAEVVGLCLGTYVLAWAGLLDRRRAATHWEYERDFTRRFPEVLLDSNALYTSDERLTTSAGTAAGIDCCLNIIRERYGVTIANKIARRMVVPPHREGGQAQYIERPLPKNTRDGSINELIDYLRQNLDMPHDIASLASFVCMSRRTFTRRFMQATGATVSSWLNAERLQRSQGLLETTGHSIEKIAGLSGFQSPVSFRQRFKARFNVSPSEWRKTFRDPNAVFAD